MNTTGQRISQNIEDLRGVNPSESIMNIMLGGYDDYSTGPSLPPMMSGVNPDQDYGIPMARAAVLLVMKEWDLSGKEGIRQAEEIVGAVGPDNIFDYFGVQWGQ